MKKTRIGLTGGIGCGKSALCKLLLPLGWTIVDTDSIVHELYLAGGEGYKKVVDAFGKNILNSDNSVNRTSLGNIVFSDPEKRRLLNSLIHPLVRDIWQSRLNGSLAEKPHSPVLVVIPLMFESEMNTGFESVVCVGCSPQEQQARLKARGLSPSQIEKRLEAQWPLERKMQNSQVVIWNSGSIELLRSQAERLNSRWHDGNL